MVLTIYKKPFELRSITTPGCIFQSIQPKSLRRCPAAAVATVLCERVCSHSHIHSRFSSSRYIYSQTSLLVMEITLHIGLSIGDRKAQHGSDVDQWNLPMGHAIVLFIPVHWNKTLQPNHLCEQKKRSAEAVFCLCFFHEAWAKRMVGGGRWAVGRVFLCACSCFSHL